MSISEQENKKQNLRHEDLCRLFGCLRGGEGMQSSVSMACYVHMSLELDGTRATALTALLT
jgi:hypothetical protein